MPTPGGKETTQERETRQRAEDYAAMRAAITAEMRAQAQRDADNPETEYAAGAALTLRAGARRTLNVDAGRLEALALADELEARGLTIIANRTTFGLYAGRGSIRYGVTAR